jgi:hypothetical protein
MDQNLIKIILCLLLALYSVYSYINKKSNLRIVSPLILILLIILSNFGTEEIKIQSEKISLNQVKQLVANS